MTSVPAALRPRLAVDGIALASFLGVALVVVALAGRPIGTDDLWWHLALGEMYASEGPTPRPDPLLHTTSEPTVPHEWLFQVAVHGVERGFGFFGLRVLHAAAAAGLLAWVFRVFHRASGSRALAALAGVVFATLSWYRLFQLRPELASLAALLGLYVLVLERATAPGRARVAAALVLLVVWANAHSMFAIGLALLLAALLGAALDAWAAGRAAPPGEAGNAQRVRSLAVVLAVGAVVTAANPRGFDQHATFLVESATGDIWRLRDDFLPWNPVSPPHDNPAFPLLAWLLADVLLAGFGATSAALLLRAARERSRSALRDLDCVHLGLAAAAFAAMFVSVRFHWMAVFPLLYLLRAGRRAIARADSGPRRLARWLPGCAAAASAALAAAFAPGIGLAAWRDELSWQRDGYWRSPYLDARYCGPAMRFLRDARLEGHLFHPFNLGGFLGYWLAPRLRTFIDGRLDHVPSDVLADYVTIRRAVRLGASGALARRLDARGIDLYLGTTFRGDRYREGSWTDLLRRLPGWITVFASQDCAVLARRGERGRDDLARVAAYYRRLRIPFSPNRGLDAGAAIRRQPDWARTSGLVPDAFAGLVAATRSGAPDERAAALDAVAALYWRVGAFREQIPLDRELLALRPDAREPRRRLADALLQIGRPAEALEPVRELLRAEPSDADLRSIERLAARRARSR